MRWRCVTMDEWRRLENAHFILVGRCDLAGVRTAVECGNADVVVCGSRNDLDTFEGAGENDDVAASSVCLGK